MQFLILGWLVLELTDSASRMGFMIFLYGMPTLGFVLFGGIFADRFDRRGLLMLTQALVGLLVLGLAVLETAGLVALWHIYAAAFVLGTLQAINTPTRLAIVRDLMDRDDLMNAVVLNSAVMNSGRILGPALAGGVIELAGVTPALYLAAGCFCVGTVTLLMVRRVPLAARDRRSTILSELWGGLRYCWSNPVTFTVIGIGFAFGFFAMPYARRLYPPLHRPGRGRHNGSVENGIHDVRVHIYGDVGHCFDSGNRCHRTVQSSNTPRAQSAAIAKRTGGNWDGTNTIHRRTNRLITGTTVKTRHSQANSRP